MSEQGAFNRLLERFRRGEQDAATELIAAYGPELQRAIRFELRRTKRNAVFDESDVFQSVMRTFVVRAGLGQYDLQGESDLRKLLARIAHNKVVGIVRRETAMKRGGADGARVELNDALTAAQGETPSETVAGREILSLFESRLPDRARRIRDLRTSGFSWEEIAQQLGGSGEAVRKEFVRAVNHAVTALGLQDLDDE